MADPTLVNGQITDAVTQSNLKTLGESPATAIGSLYQSVAQSTALLAQNTTSAQQQMNTINEAITASCANLLANGE
jgi:hypothetical protein